MTKRALQAEATRQHIFETTIRLMNANGFNNMTIQDIIEQAGVSVGTFYHYFNSKEDVFFKLYSKADEYFETVVLPQLRELDRGAHEQIIEFFRHYAAFNERNGLEYVSLLYSTKNKFFIEKKRFMITLLFDIVTTGQKNKEITRDETPDAITDYLFILSRGVIFDWCIHEGSYSLVDTMLTHIHFAMRIFRI